MNALTILVVALVGTNVLLLLFYLSSKSSKQEVGYDKESKEKLKTRVTTIKMEMKQEHVDMGWLKEYLED